MNQFKIALISLAAAALSACGGGGGDNQPPAASSSPVTTPVVVPVVTPAPAPVVAPVPVNAAPTGNAGADQSVFVGSTVVVDGGASHDGNGDPLTHKWSISTRPVTSGATLSSGTNVRPTFVADVAGIYIVTLVVNDGKIDAAPVTATIIASEKPAAPNAIPSAHAGANQTALVGTKVTLDGTASADKNGDALKYKWILVSKPVGSTTTVSADGTVKPGLLLDTAGTYSVTLTVNDGKSDSLPATVLVTAIKAPSPENSAPIANAGKDQTVSVGSTVDLDASSSTDPNGDQLTYAWSITAKPAGSTGKLTTTTAVKPQFVADVTGIYELTLSVSDGKATSLNKDVVNIVATSPNTVTIADSGLYRCTTLTRQLALSLYAQGHTYLDRDHDGRPCEANDIANEVANPYVATTPSTGGQCYVSGYYRKNGTYVKGYFRRCPS